MITAFGNVDGTAWPHLVHHRVAVLVLDHLFAAAGDDEDDLLGTRMVVAGMALASAEIDHAGGKTLRSVDLRTHGQRQPAPVQSEGVHFLRIDESPLLAAHSVLPFDGMASVELTRSRTAAEGYSRGSEADRRVRSRFAANPLVQDASYRQTERCGRIWFDQFAWLWKAWLKARRSAVPKKLV